MTTLLLFCAAAAAMFADAETLVMGAADTVTGY